MIPELLLVKDKAIQYPRWNLTPVAGCPKWKKGHARYDGFDILLWAHDDDEDFMVDILSNSRGESLEVVAMSVAGQKTQHVLAPYEGVGFSSVRFNLALHDHVEMMMRHQFQPSTPQGFGLAFSARPMTPQTLTSRPPMDIKIHARDYLENGSPRALDQMLRLLSYELSTNSVYDVSKPLPYQGDSAMARDLLWALAQILKCLKGSSDLSQLYTYFSGCLYTHATKMLALFKDRLDCREILLPGLEKAAEYTEIADTFIKETKEALKL